MSTEQSEFNLDQGAAYARQSDPDTSHEAAAEVSGESASRMEKIALEALAGAPNGLTNHELVEKTGLLWNTISPRIRPLVRKGLVIDSGERRIGPTNRKCIVWKKI